MDEPSKRRMVKPSQGIHLVFDKSFLKSDYAIMIPKTSDGRVLFAVPWHEKVVVGTTDIVRDTPEIEPKPLDEEIDFIMNTAALYMTKKPTKSDILSVFAGQRPLAAPKKEGKSTKEISRSHKIFVSDNDLITITGGKWTTYRKMAEDTVDRAISLNLLPKSKCKTKNYKIHGYRENPDLSNHLYVYGSDMPAVEKLKNSGNGMNEKIHPKYDYSVA
jgi:glycerol-3-phosphate dehydrogenase